MERVAYMDMPEDVVGISGNLPEGGIVISDPEHGRLKRWRNRTTMQVPVFCKIDDDGDGGGRFITVEIQVCTVLPESWDLISRSLVKETVCGLRRKGITDEAVSISKPAGRPCQLKICIKESRCQYHDLRNVGERRGVVDRKSGSDQGSSV